MASINKITRGLQLLAEHHQNGTVDAQHDELFCSGPPPDQMPSEVVAELDRLGWLWDESDECWSVFT